MPDFRGIVYGGQKLDVCDSGCRKMVGDAFSIEKEYAIGDYCIYKNIFYKFTKTKEAGEWNPDIVQTTTLQKELSELNDDLGGLKFGVDADGNYGYYEAGADTVTPFSRGSVKLLLDSLKYSGLDIDESSTFEDICEKLYEYFAENRWIQRTIYWNDLISSNLSTNVNKSKTITTNKIRNVKISGGLKGTGNASNSGSNVSSWNTFYYAGDLLNPKLVSKSVNVKAAQGTTYTADVSISITQEMEGLQITIDTSTESWGRIANVYTNLNVTYEEFI